MDIITPNHLRRPLSRDSSRREPWAGKWDPHNIDQLHNMALGHTRSLAPTTLRSSVGPATVQCGPTLADRYGHCECLAGRVTTCGQGEKTNTCAPGYVAVCSGERGSRCICSNLNGDSGCLSAKGKWCPG